MSSDNFKALFSNGNVLDIPENDSFRVLEEKDNQLIVQLRNDIYNIEIVDFDPHSKSYNLLINDHPVSLKLKNKLDQLIDQMGLNVKKEENISQVKAPMPGLVVNLKVKEGDTVSENDPLLILEAMKMENVIKSKGGGVVRKIHVEENDKVEKGQLLVEF